MNSKLGGVASFKRAIDRRKETRDRKSEVGSQRSDDNRSAAKIGRCSDQMADGEVQRPEIGGQPERSEDALPRRPNSLSQFLATD